MIEFLIVIGLIAIVSAVIQDFKTREVANWINFSLIIFALAFRMFYSVFSGNYKFLIIGIYGLGIAFVLGHLFYYGRLFAGGDAKLLIALGAVIPFSDNFYTTNFIFIIFLISLLFGGAVYSIGYSFVIAMKSRDKFFKETKRIFFSNISYLYALLAFSSIFVIYTFFSLNYLFLLFPLFAILIFLTYVYAKSIEQSCMLVETPVERLTIGDWLGTELKVKNKTIIPNWEGLTKEQIEFIRKHYKGKVLIKQGIPFTPAFLIAFLVIVYIQYFLSADFSLLSIIN